MLGVYKTIIRGLCCVVMGVELSIQAWSRLMTNGNSTADSYIYVKVPEE
jgi:hypothetical protein